MVLELIILGIEDELSIWKHTWREGTIPKTFAVRAIYEFLLSKAVGGHLESTTRIISFQIQIKTTNKLLPKEKKQNCYGGVIKE